MNIDWARFKDRSFLLFTGIVCAICAAFFWKYMGDYGFLILNVLAFAILFTDNAQLRKKVRELSSK